MERYGTIPKRFTKAWWEYFWYYYKWYVIGILGSVICITVTCVQCATRPNYDATISYVGFKFYEDKNVEQFKSAVSEIIDDKNNDGEKLVQVIQMTVSQDGSLAAGTEYDNAVHSKIAVEFQVGETYMYLFNKQEIDRLINRESAEQIFVKTTDLYSSEIPKEKLLYKDGVPYAVDLSGNKFLEENGLKDEDVYLAVRCMRSADMDKEQERIMYNNAVKLANHIVNNDR